MAKTQDLKRRIRSVRNTMQLTNAMKMVSAAKLRRAQERIMNARPYAQQTLAVLRSLAARAGEDAHPLLQSRVGKKAHIVLLAGDKGLCGAFNAHIIRTAEDYAREKLHGQEISITAVGKKSVDYFERRPWEIKHRWVELFRNVQFTHAEEIASAVSGMFLSGEIDRVYVAYNEFKSAIQAKPIVQPLLPIQRVDLAAGDSAEDYIYEPSAAALLEALLPHYVRHLIFQALLESAGAEHAARMTAMDSATNNASELIDALTLTMNRVRQASITTEIIEVVSGAEALG
jgi:F-type H+-transporting ATPase subunit gamma